MYYSELVKKACVIMYDAHKEDKDKGGYPYGATCSQLKRLGTCPMIGGEKKDR